MAERKTDTTKLSDVATSRDDKAGKQVVSTSKLRTNNEIPQTSNIFLDLFYGFLNGWDVDSSFQDLQVDFGNLRSILSLFLNVIK